MFNCEGFSEGEQKRKIKINYMFNVSIPANADNKVVAGENAKVMTEKIYIVRERRGRNWGRFDDTTTAYATREMAEAAMLKNYRNTRRMYEVMDIELLDYNLEVDRGELWTCDNADKDDYYCWIEEIEVFNE